MRSRFDPKKLPQGEDFQNVVNLYVFAVNRPVNTR
jgi:hypothetical protein